MPVLQVFAVSILLAACLRQVLVATAPSKEESGLAVQKPVGKCVNAPNDSGAEKAVVLRLEVGVASNRVRVVVGWCLKLVFRREVVAGSSFLKPSAKRRAQNRYADEFAHTRCLENIVGKAEHIHSILLVRLFRPTFYGKFTRPVSSNAELRNLDVVDAKESVALIGNANARLFVTERLYLRPV